MGVIVILTISRAKNDNDDDENEKLLLEQVSAHSRDLLSVGEIFGLHKSTLRQHLEIFWAQRHFVIFGLHNIRKFLGSKSPHRGNIWRFLASTTFGHFWAPQYLEIFGLHKSTPQKHFKM